MADQTTGPDEATRKAVFAGLIGKKIRAILWPHPGR